MMGNCIHFLAISWTSPAPVGFGACDLSTYPAPPLRRNRGAAHVLTAPSALFAPKAARAAGATDAGPRHLHATDDTVCADFELGGVAVRSAAGVSISNSRTFARDLVSSLHVNQCRSPTCVSSGLSFRHWLRPSSFRITAKAGTGMFVELGRGVTMYFARGFLGRIRSQLETVWLQFKAIRQRLQKVPDRKTDKRRPMPPPLRQTISLP
jgi:hypothetical protein